MDKTILNSEKIFQNVVTQVFSPLYQLVAALAFLYFLWGVFKYIYDMNDPEKKTTGRNHMLWGLVGLFIIFSIGGILPLFNKILGGMFLY